MNNATLVALLFIPSCVVWFLKINTRSVTFPDWIRDLFGDFRNYEASSCRFAKFDSVPDSLFFSQCRGRYVVLCDIFEKNGSLSEVAVLYISVAGFLSFARENKILPFLVAGSFLLAPAVAFILHRLVYRGQSRGEKLSSYELDEWLRESPKEDCLNNVSYYFEQCTNYIHTCSSTNTVCFFLIAIQVVSAYVLEGYLP